MNAINLGSVATGWPFSLSLAVPSTDSMSLVLIGILLVAVSCLLTSVNFIASIHHLRATEMTWSHMPLLLWSLYASCGMQLLIVPILSIVCLIVLSERALAMGFFQRDLGGGDAIYSHLIWFFAHSAVYVMLLPAMGAVSEILSVHSHKRMVGYRLVAWSMVAIAACSPFAWAANMPFIGQVDHFSAISSLLSFLVVLPMSTIIFSWIATLLRGSIAWNTPMLYSIMFLLILAIGVLSGLFLNSLATRVMLHDTVFEAAHLHYLWGSVLIGFIAAVHHWWPKITGRMFNDGHGVLCAWLVFAGFHLALFPQFLAGTQGLTRRMSVYPAQFEIYQQISTCGTCLLAVGMLGLAYCLLQSLFQGERATSNPWQATTWEWHCSSPPTWDNLSESP